MKNERFSIGTLWSVGSEPEQFGIIEDSKIDFETPGIGFVKIMGRSKIARIFVDKYRNLFENNSKSGTITPTFSITFHNNQKMLCVLNVCVSPQITIPTRTDYFEIGNFEFSAFADVNGSIGWLG